MNGRMDEWIKWTTLVHVYAQYILTEVNGNAPTVAPNPYNGVPTIVSAA